MIQESGSNKDLALLSQHEIERAFLELGFRAHGVTCKSTSGELSFTFEYLQEGKNSAPLPRSIVFDLNGVFADGQRRLPNNVCGIGCTSKFARNKLIDSGVEVPLSVVGMGVDHWERIFPKQTYHAPGRKFRFLHVSDCNHESGIDVLLDVFGRVFDNLDDVSLIIKPGKGLSSTAEGHLDYLRSTINQYPDVVIIRDNLSDSEMKALYASCQVFVSPSRGCDFGMPVAQALLSGMPIVTTAWGGHMDYCDVNNSWFVDYEFRKDNISPGSPITIEPLIASFEQVLWEVYIVEPEERLNKAWRGRRRLLESFTWKDVALRLVSFTKCFQKRYITREVPSRVGWVTTWNVKCGIGVFVEHLLASRLEEDHMIFAARQAPQTRIDQKNVVRSWVVDKIHNGLDEVSRWVSLYPIGALVIQFNFGFFNHFELSTFIEDALRRNLVVCIDLHSTIDPYGGLENYRLGDFIDALRKCDRIFVHNFADLERMKEIGLVENVKLFPLGVLKRGRATGKVRQRREIPLITSFGFCFETKGLVELVRAISILKDENFPIKLRMLNAQYDSQHSIDLVKKIRAEIFELGLEDNVDFRSEYLEDDACLELLTDADLFVNPYQRTNESASAAVRYGLAAEIPVAVTPLKFFDDLGDAVYRMPGVTPRDIANGIRAALGHLRENSDVAKTIEMAAQTWLMEHDYAVLSERLTRNIYALMLKSF